MLISTCSIDRRIQKANKKRPTIGLDASRRRPQNYKGQSRTAAESSSPRIGEDETVWVADAVIFGSQVTVYGR